jgi:hypothetical protein
MGPGSEAAEEWLGGEMRVPLCSARESESSSLCLVLQRDDLSFCRIEELSFLAIDDLSDRHHHGVRAYPPVHPHSGAPR